MFSLVAQGSKLSCWTLHRWRYMSYMSCRKYWYIYSEERIQHHVLPAGGAPQRALYHNLEWALLQSLSNMGPPGGSYLLVYLFIFFVQCLHFTLIIHFYLDYFDLQYSLWKRCLFLCLKQHWWGHVSVHNFVSQAKAINNLCGNSVSCWKPLVGLCSQTPFLN